MELSKDFSVILFKAENSVEAVPTSWVSRDKLYCKYPNVKGSKLSKLLKTSGSLPNTDWKQHSVRVLAESADYKTARNYANRAEYTSAVESEQEITRTRRRTKQTLSVPQNTAETSSSSDISHVSDIASSTGIPDFPSPGITNEYEVNTTNQNTENEEWLRETNAGSNPSVYVPETSNISALSEQQNRFQELVLTKLASIENEVKIISLKLAQQTKEDTVNYSQQLPNLPALDKESLTNIETWLLDDNNKTTLAKYLSLIGGSNADHAVRNMLVKCISKLLANEINFTGKNNKIPFQSFHLYSVIKDAVRLTPAIKDTTVFGIDKTIKSWLTFAPPRKSNSRLADQH